MVPVAVKGAAETPAVVCGLLPHLHSACRRWRCIENPITTATVGQLVLVIGGESLVCSLLYLAGALAASGFFRKSTPKIGYFTATWRSRHSTSRRRISAGQGSLPNMEWLRKLAGPSNLGPMAGWGGPVRKNA